MLEILAGCALIGGIAIGVCLLLELLEVWGEDDR